MTAEEERNLAVALRWTLLYNTDPGRCCDETLADDIQANRAGQQAQTPGGREAYRAAVRANLVAVPDRKQRVIAVAADGDRVFVEMSWEGTSSGEDAARFGPSGTPVKLPCISVLRIADGRIVSETIYT